MKKIINTILCYNITFFFRSTPSSFPNIIVTFLMSLPPIIVTVHFGKQQAKVLKPVLQASKQLHTEKCGNKKYNKLSITPNQTSSEINMANFYNKIDHNIL